MGLMSRGTLVVALVGITLGSATAWGGEELRKDDGAADTAVELPWSGVSREVRLGGTVTEQGSWLLLDQPLVFARGSRSERVVERVRLVATETLRDELASMDRRHAELEGTMECTMHFSPWTASCSLRVKRVEAAK